MTGDRHTGYGPAPEPELLPPDFTSYGWNVWHCQRCHRVVRWYDTDSANDAYAALLGHRTFNCFETAMVAAP